MTSRYLLLFVGFVSLACGADVAGFSDGSPPDSSTPDAGILPPLEKGQAGGYPGAIRLAGDRAYLGIGPRVAIWDVSNPAIPILLGETQPLTGPVTDVLIDGDIAFVSTARLLEDGALHVVDVANPVEPSIITTVVLDHQQAKPWGLAVSGSRLFVADNYRGIRVFDVSDPAAPVQTGMVVTGGASQVWVVGSRLYYASREGASPMVVGGLSLDADLEQLGTTVALPEPPFARAIAVSPGDLVISVNPSYPAIQVFDMTDPWSPVEIYDDSLPSYGYGSAAVAANSDAAWILGNSEVRVLDLTSDPMTATAIEAPTESSTVADVSGPLLAALSVREGLVTFDVTAPTSPTLQGRAEVTLCFSCEGVAVRGSELFVADARRGLSIAAVGNLELTGVVPVPSQEERYLADLALANNHVFVADELFGMRVYDVSDPEAAEELDGFEIGQARAVAVTRGRAYVLDGLFAEGSGLFVLDVADPAHVTQLGYIPIASPRDIAAAGELVFVSSSGGYGAPTGLLIFEASDPAAIQMIGHYAGCYEPEGVAIAGTIAVVACAGDGLHVVDVKDPSSPRQLFAWPSENAQVRSVAIGGDRAALGHGLGVTVIDISDPSAPVLVSEHPTSESVMHLAIVPPGRVIASCGVGGVYQWDVD